VPTSCPPDLVPTPPPPRPHPTSQGAKEALAAGVGDWSESKALWVAAVCGASLAVFTLVVVCPLLWKRLNARFEE
jgi:hypothetical protein